MRNGYMVVETTALHNSVCFSLQSTKALENGVVVGKGDLVTGETDIYVAEDAYANGMYLVANPAWTYNRYTATDFNEENYINPANVPLKTYRLEKDMKYKIYNVPDGVTLAEGDFIEYTAGVLSKAAGNTKLKVVRVEEVGFPFCIGSAGTDVGDYGYAIGDVTKKYTIQVVE